MIALPIITKTIAILGGAYGGARAAQILAAGIPNDWRIILVDRNSHANHVYIMPRLAVLPDHEYKAFVPFDHVYRVPESDYPIPHLVLQASVKSLHANSVVLSRTFPEHGINTTTLHFDYAVYALGSTLPAPLDLWGSEPGEGGAPKSEPIERLPYNGTKQQSMDWLKRNQAFVEKSASVLVVGGGALGIQFATDIAAVHPTKKITLLHSRTRLLPRFDEGMHAEILQSLISANIDVILGERLDLDSIGEEPKTNALGQRIVRTVKGRVIAADMIMLCTGQAPNTSFLKVMDERTVHADTKLAHVLRTMQLGVISPTTSPLSDVPAPATEKSLRTALEKLELDESSLQAGLAADTEEKEEPLEETPYPNIFVVGDAANAFGAIPAGHTAYYQAEVAARNILTLIAKTKTPPSDVASRLTDDMSTPVELERYTPGPPAIKVSLGLTKSVYQVDGVIGVKNDGVPDLQASAIWAYFGIEVKSDEDMRR